MRKRCAAVLATEVVAQNENQISKTLSSKADLSENQLLGLGRMLCMAI
jgi:hypothetical protein